MKIETDKNFPLDINLMLNKTDIDKLIERLQFLKNNPNGHIDIFCTDFENAHK